VIETGPGKAGTDLTEEITVAATGGEFVLGYELEKAKLKYNATAGEVEEALNKLKMVEQQKGHLKVEEGPGDETGSKPYRVTYEGGMGDEEQLSIECNNENLVGGQPSSSVKCLKIKEGAQAFEDCVVASGDVCRGPSGGGTSGREFETPQSVAVDQSTGNVYVLDHERIHGVVRVFSADGEKQIATFGEKTLEPLEEPIGSGEKNPAELRYPESIAVDTAGNVYISDEGAASHSGVESRIAVFSPVTPGKYEAYKYAETIARQCGFVACVPQQVAVGSGGTVFFVGGILDERVFEFVGGGLVCESGPFATLEGLAVDPGTGEAVVYSKAANRFLWLDACKGGVLEENASRSFAGVNKAGGKEKRTTSLAWNPGLVWEVDRPKGGLYAVNPGDPTTGGLRTGLIFAQSVVHRPKVLGESVSGVGSGFATLGARVATEGNPTHYVFQYSTENTAGCSPGKCLEVPVGGGVLGVGGEDVAATVGGLSPGTTYHFRVVGFSDCNPEVPGEECELEGGVDHEFVTFPSGPVLGDHRAYELVSPAVKDGGEVFPASARSAVCGLCSPGVENEHFPMQSTVDGDKVVYEGDPFSSAGAAVNEDEYLASRGTGGWSSRDLSPAFESKDGSLTGYKAFAGDLSRGVLAQTGPVLCPEAPAGYADLYLLGGVCEGQPGLQPLLTSSTPHKLAASEFAVTFGGASEDFSHIVFEANDALTPETPLAPGALVGSNIYEWSASGELQLVNVLPGNKSAPPAAVLGSGADLATTTGDPDFAHAVSADGSRIFWTDENNHHVYVRENGDETVRVRDEGSFLVASANGSEVLLNDGHLYDLETEQTTDLTGNKGGFAGILGASEDLSSVYFVDGEILTSEENNEHATAQKGQDNIYYWHDGTVAFVGTLNPKDNFDGAAFGLVYGETGDWMASPSDRGAQVSANGRYVAFISLNKLTKYENSVASGECVKGVGAACYEVFEYDGQTKRLVCVSCNPTGERPLGSSTLSLTQPGSGFLPQPSNLSENGRVFFNSADALSPQVQNPGVENVYEYEPSGIGTCGRENGCIYLISSGTGSSNSDFVNATPSGSDVFFTTRSQLVPEDQDDLIDLYDARENGGIRPEGKPAECASSATCQGPSSAPPPATETPLSASLSGTDNLTPSPLPPPPPPPPPPSKLARALAACHRHKGWTKRHRVACEKRARKLYGAKKASKSRSNAGVNGAGRER
jgi:hypothetical protein